MNPITKVRQTRVENPLVAGLIYSFLWLGIAALLVSLLLTLTRFQEESLSLYTYVIHGASVCIGGFVSGKRAGLKGWYKGGLMGIIYALLIILISFLGFDASLHTHTGILIVLSSLCGALGGIFGVNARK